MTNIQLPDVGVTMALVANLKAGLPDFGRIVDQFGHPAPALRQLGYVHWENGRFGPAARTFEAALPLVSEDPDLWRDLASVYSASDWLMAQMDLAASNAAARRARGRCVTVAVDGMVFHTPVHGGDEVSVYADLISTGRTSMKF